MYMYKPQYKNKKLILDVKPMSNLKQSLSVIGYAAIPALVMGIPFLLGK